VVGDPNRGDVAVNLRPVIWKKKKEKICIRHRVLQDRKKENPSPWKQRGWEFFEQKTLSWTNNPSISFFGLGHHHHHHDDETSELCARSHSFLSASKLVIFILARNDMYTRVYIYILKRDKEKENKKMCSRTTQKEKVHSERTEDESFYVRTTRASSRISTPRWRCCTFEHR